MAMITLENIASRAGVTHVTVSRVLNGTYRAKRPDAVRRAHYIRQLASDLGYRPNTAARTIATGKFNAVGLVMSTHDSQSTVFGAMMRGIHDRLAADRIHLVATFLDDARLTSDDAVPRILGEIMVDGLLINYTHAIPPHMAELIDRYRLPAVWVNSKQAANCVYPDDEGAGYAATRLLLEAGHQRIMYLDLTAAVEDSAETHYSHTDRRAGYERAMREADHEPLAVVEARRLVFQKPVEQARQILSSDTRPTAIVGYCRHDAEALLLACVDLRLTMGRDLSLVIIEQSQPLIGPQIDTLLLPEFEVGHAAGEMLLARISDPNADQQARAISMDHKPGQTVCPVVSR